MLQLCRSVAALASKGERKWSGGLASAMGEWGGGESGGGASGLSENGRGTAERERAKIE